MSFIKVHGIELAGGSAEIRNAVIESLADDLTPTVEQIGRIYYKETDEVFKGIYSDGAGGAELKTFATADQIASADADFETFKTELASNSEGLGSNLVGYEGFISTNFSVASGALDVALDAIVNELSDAKDRYVDVAGDSMTGELSMGSNKITNVANPENDNDAATKAYVDAARLGLDAKASCRVSTTENIDIADSYISGLNIDGINLNDNDRVLVKNQTDATENGIYTFINGSGFTRAEDADEPEEVTANIFTFIEEGTTLADTGWVLTTNDPITIGTHDLNFVQFSAAGQITAGTALTKTGLELNVNYDNTTIVVNGSNQLAIASDYLDTVNSTISVLQGELDDTQTGAGLGSDGAYVVDTSSNYLSGATSLANADGLLDTAIKQVADDLAALGSGSLTDLQNEVDTIESTMGSVVAEDGSYVAFTTSNYINGNTSVSEDLLDLDTQAKVNEDAISTLQSEVDTTQTGAGLGTDGVYSANNASNYITTATSLVNADDLLDAAIKQVADDLAALGSGSLTDLQNEVNTIESAVGLEEDGTLSMTLTSPSLSGATTVKSAIEAIDAEINADNTEVANLQAELDVTQVGAGLGTDGVYIVDSTSETISGATSLADADSKLANAIEALEADIEASKFEFTGTGQTTYSVIHNLNSDFVNVCVWVLDPEDSKWRNDLVGKTIVDANTVQIDLTVARDIRVSVTK